jgi:hypothetical protein
MSNRVRGKNKMCGSLLDYRALFGSKRAKVTIDASARHPYGVGVSARVAATAGLHR